MEIARAGQAGLRIKTKNASFLVNPEKKIEEDIVVLTQKPNDYSTFLGKVVIDSPGDYEVSGVSIKCEKQDSGLAFIFIEEGQRLVVLSSAAVAKNADMEDASAVVVFLDETAKDALSQVACEIVAAIGPSDFLPADKSNIKTAEKINLKKADEHKGFIVHLTK